MARKIDRLNRLEKELKPDIPPKVVVCWCDRDKGHNPDCPGNTPDPNTKIVNWPDHDLEHKADCPAIDPEPNTMVVRVRYNRLGDLAENNSNA